MTVKYKSVIVLSCLPDLTFQKDGDSWNGLQNYIASQGGEGFIAKANDFSFGLMPKPLYDDGELTILFASNGLKAKLKEQQND